LGDLIEADQIVELCNKIDLLSTEENKALELILSRKENSLPISAISGKGIEDFLNYIEEILSKTEKNVELIVPNHEGKAIAWIFEFADVKNSDSFDDDNMIIKARINSEYLSKLEYNFPFIKKKVY